MKTQYEITYEQKSKISSGISTLKCHYTAENAEEAKNLFLTYHRENVNQKFKILSCIKK